MIAAPPRSELEDLFAAYGAAIDEELERWPEFFAPDAVYRIVARENFERGLPLSTVLAEGHGMMRDRITAIRQTTIYQPRVYRHLIANVRVLGAAERGTRVGANFAVYESPPLAGSRLLVVGRYIDIVERDDSGGLRFAEKTCVYDGNVVQSSLVYPI
jgi:3-phenylpropionate/cinnamic acid dioxygenase small subunit